MNDLGGFLSSDDVARLTGSKVKRVQLAELDRLGVRYFVNRRGETIVLWSAVEAANRGGNCSTFPNLAALE